MFNVWFLARSGLEKGSDYGLFFVTGEEGTQFEAQLASTSNHTTALAY